MLELLKHRRPVGCQSSRGKQFLKGALLGGILAWGAVAPTTTFAAASWAPTASERLIKLPGQHLEKAIERDFQKSQLATALQEAQSRTELKQSTLGDLQQAIERADEDTRYDLQHQFLMEKKSYVQMLKESQDLRRKRAVTKLRLYEHLLKKLNRKKQTHSPQQKQLVQLQENAQARFQSNLSKVDMKLMQSLALGESRYSSEYAHNKAAIENLVAAVNAHPSNHVPETNGITLSQADYVRHLITQNEAELALVDQERIILGHMAKLVSLDALALTEQTQLALEDTDVMPGDKERSYGLEYFITQ